MIDYFIQSFRRKRARRVTKEYPTVIDRFNLGKDGMVEFANWDNPLVGKITLIQDDVEFYRRFIKEGDLVIDIGGNVGDTTVPMALAAGKTGMTLAFDPNPYVFKVLAENARLNREKTNIVPLLYAISVDDEEFYFISSEASFSNGGISPTKESIHGKYVYPHKIKGINLMGLLEKEYSDRLDKLSFIKVDTEGYDKEILKSISDLLLKYKPAIVAESFGDSTDEEKMELYDVLDRNGYEVFYFGNADHPEDPNVNPTINVEVIKLTDRKHIAKWKKTINIYATPKK